MITIIGEIIIIFILIETATAIIRMEKTQREINENIKNIIKRIDNGEV